ncbi:LAMI_0G09868g1_1 [Lachancea mirantina]|uniref:LAMI_0G09868g1_1 n=1 Tax=Lachancea mirantina TaxID=1230905 RepID=A0A1G4KAG8_9SACH|nr:LAMI_0G09868g1_1 [Lachancea mirantina]
MPEATGNPLLSKSFGQHTETPRSPSDFDLYANDDDDTFDLPLKSRFPHTDNFQELDAIPGLSGLDKKVRFEKDVPDTPTPSFPNSSVCGADELCVSKTETNSSSSSRKPHIEELIQHAQALDQYLGQNIHQINSFRSHLGSRTFYKSDETGGMGANSSSSIAATALTSASGSASNFVLSDSECSDYYEDDDHDIHSSAGANFDFKSIKDILSQHQPSAYPQKNLQAESADNIDERSNGDFSRDTSRPASLDSLPVGNGSVSQSPLLKIDYQREVAKSLSETTRPPDNCYSDVSAPEISASGALTVLTKTLQDLLSLSNKQNPIIDSSGESETDFKKMQPFRMKAAPTLGYEKYLDRLNTKFSFEPIVYLAAAYLLQKSVLHKVDNDLRVLVPLRSECVHRFIIAAIRISTKLLDDCIHSHAHFSKICGISKRLLTRLEVALLDIINYEGLKITNERLLSAIKTQEKLHQKADVDAC